MSLSANVDNAAQIDLPQVGAESIITFSQGLIGQPDWKRFILLTADDDPAVGVLQSLDQERVSLMVISPKRVVEDYVPVLTPAEWTALELQDDEQPVVLATLSIHNENIFANLLGPLVINARTREGMQIVLADSVYSTRHPVGRLAQDSESCSS